MVAEKERIGDYGEDEALCVQLKFVGSNLLYWPLKASMYCCKRVVPVSAVHVANKE
jgi:hypothetical protein